MDTGSRYVDVSLMALLFGGTSGGGFPAPVNPVGPPMEIDLLKMATGEVTVYDLVTAAQDIIAGVAGKVLVPIAGMIKPKFNGSVWPAWEAHHSLFIGFLLNGVLDSDALLHFKPNAGNTEAELIQLAYPRFWTWYPSTPGQGLSFKADDGGHNDLPVVAVGDLATVEYTVFYAEA